MQYDLSNPLHRNQVKLKLDSFINKGSVVDLTEKKKKRSLAQNSYLHLILSWFALEYGETIEYVKQIMFKQLVNPHIFKTEYANRQTGDIREDWRSTADLNIGELTEAIDRFRNYASKEANIYLPEPTDLTSMQSIEIEISRNKQYL